MIVFDASAAVLALLNDGDARRQLAEEAVSCPHLIDSEVAHALRSGVLRKELTATAARRALAGLGPSRHPSGWGYRSARPDLVVACQPQRL